MNRNIAVVVLAMAFAACSQQSPAPPQSTEGAPQLDAPAPETEPSRVFSANNDAARQVSPELTVSTILRLPDASQSGQDAHEVLILRGPNGVAVEAQITSVVSPATQVQAQTLRALLDLPVEEPQTLVYRVTSETKSQSGRGLCGTDTTAYVIVWEPSTPGESTMKILGLTGGAPGAAGARACPMLEYRRI